MSERADHDVVIAGAGPAGVATALALVRAEPSLVGRVLVVDRARFPRAKPCGGGLTGHLDEALAAVGLSLTVPAIASESAVVRYGGIEREVALPRPVRTVRREEFDQSLVEQARARGIEVREGASLTGFEVQPGGVTVSVGEQRLRSRVLVGADGVGSLVRKALVGHRGARSDGASRSLATSPEPSTANARDEDTAVRPIRLLRAEIPDPGTVPRRMLYDFTPMLDGLRGYLWIFPAPGGRLNVGLLHDPSTKLGGAALAEILRRRLRAYGLEVPTAALRGWPAWGYAPASPVSATRVLTVGDAAGIDALTGEGIAVAMEQGAIAARLIVDGLRRDDFAFSTYRRALRRATVGRELTLDGVLARLLYGSRDHRLWLSLVLLDDQMLATYAARVSGTAVLASQKGLLLRSLARHLWLARGRVRTTREAERASL